MIEVVTEEAVTATESQEGINSFLPHFKSLSFTEAFFISGIAQPMDMITDY